MGCPPEVPVTGERKNVKIFGAIDLWRTRFHYAQDTVFNASTYGAFLEQLGRCYRRRGAMLIQDNASYHKDKDIWSWFKSHRHWLEVHQLPAYCPELNPTERLWQHAQNRNSQSFLRDCGRTSCYSHTRVHRHATLSHANPSLLGTFLLIYMSLYLYADV